jgi:hypothetical protein
MRQALEKIIERDFFPDLPRLRAQNEYLTAVAENDFEKMQEVCKKYKVGDTPLPGKLTRCAACRLAVCLCCWFASASTPMGSRCAARAPGSFETPGRTPMPMPAFQPPAEPAPVDE